MRVLFKSKFLCLSPKNESWKDLASSMQGLFRIRKDRLKPVLSYTPRSGGGEMMRQIVAGRPQLGKRVKKVVSVPTLPTLK